MSGSSQPSWQWSSPTMGTAKGSVLLSCQDGPSSGRKPWFWEGGSLQKCVRRLPFLPYLWKWKMGPSNHSYLSMTMVEIVSLPTAPLGIIQISQTSIPQRAHLTQKRSEQVLLIAGPKNGDLGLAKWNAMVESWKKIPSFKNQDGFPV